MAAKGSSVIGFSLPAAIGMKVANPDLPVVSLSGDGGFMYGVQELATCLRHGIGFPAIVVNDGAFGIIDFLQHLSYKEGYETSLANPDFMQLAKAYQQEGVQVESPAELSKAVNLALARDKMTIIELKLKINSTPFAKY
jgi:acetolactate synthase-1/2/3 large subunit